MLVKDGGLSTCVVVKRPRHSLKGDELFWKSLRPLSSPLLFEENNLKATKRFKQLKALRSLHRAPRLGPAPKGPGACRVKGPSFADELRPNVVTQGSTKRVTSCESSALLTRLMTFRSRAREARCQHHTRPSPGREPRPPGQPLPRLRPGRLKPRLAEADAMAKADAEAKAKAEAEAKADAEATLNNTRKRLAVPERLAVTRAKTHAAWAKVAHLVKMPAVKGLQTTAKWAKATPINLVNGPVPKRAWPRRPLLQSLQPPGRSHQCGHLRSLLSLRRSSKRHRHSIETAVT